MDRQGGGRGFPAVDPAEVGIEPAWLEPFGAAMDRWVDAGRVVGGELLIVRRRRTVFHEVRGWFDREAGVPWGRGAICAIRSMTKPLVGTAALQLVAEDRLGLAQPVADILASFDGGRSRAITVGQLLTHTAGFGHPGHPAHPASYPDLVRLAEDLGATGPDHTPGQRFVYSDAGSAVLGAVVAELDGRRLEDALHERVVRPLDMNDTLAGVPAGDPRIDRVPVSYRLGEDGFEPYRRPTDPPRLPYLPGSGGLCSTAADFARFLSAWADDVRDGTGRLLPRDLAVSAVTPSPGTRDTDPRGSYGQHWWIYSTPHPGAPDAQLAFGHDGSDGTWALAVPALDLIVVYLTQSRHGDTLAAMSGLVRRLIEG